MKVVAKFLAAFVVVTTLCLSTYAYLSARTEAKAIEASVASDLLATADGVREGVLVAWAASGDAGVAAILRAIDARRTDVELAWTPGGELGTGDAVGIDREGPARRVRARVPVRFGPRAGGTLEISRVVPDEASLLREQFAEAIGVTLALVVALGAIAVVLGGALIGRPLDRLVAQARRIGEGDFSTRLASRGNDEIAALERELDAMCDRLSTLQARAEEQSAARIETLEQLRHLDRLRTVGTLASSLAHELGTPLNVLLMRSRSLAAGDADPGEVRETADVIATQVEKMSRIVRGLLDFARRPTTTVGRVRLADAARRAASLLGGVAKKNRVTLEVRVDDDVEVAASAEHVEQALTNLVTNAIQAMPAGGPLVLAVRSDSAARAPGASQPADVGIVEVKDRGVGIAPDDLARIFEPFYTTKPAGLGTGLGLNVASGIAAEHGGFIVAESVPGEGSAFSLCLPRAR